MTAEPDELPAMSDEDRQWWLDAAERPMQVYAAQLTPYLLAHEDRLNVLSERVEGEVQAIADRFDRLSEHLRLTDPCWESKSERRDLDSGGENASQVEDPGPEYVTCPTCGGSVPGWKDCMRCGGEGRLRVWVLAGGAGGRWVVDHEGVPTAGQAYLDPDARVVVASIPDHRQGCWWNSFGRQAEAVGPCPGHPILVPAPIEDGAVNEPSSIDTPPPEEPEGPPAEQDEEGPAVDLTTLPQRSWEPEGRLALATMRAAYRLGESVTFRIVGTHGTSVEVSVGRGHQQYTFAENEVGCRDAADWLEGLAKDDLTPPTPLGVREDRSEEDGRCPNRNTHEQVKP